MAAVATLPFRIAADAVGGRIEVAGEDLSDKVSAVEVRVCVHQPTVVTLHLSPTAGVIEGEGIIQVSAPGDPPDEASIICDFLALVDPDQIERDALRNADASGSLTPIMLRLLAGYARGDTP